MTTREVAVFGGSFNPPHVAHVLAVSWVLSATDVDEVVIVPTFRHPFGKDLLPYEHRVAMANLAFEPLRRVRVSRVEEELGGDSYTVRTLEALSAQMPGKQLRLVVGEDVLPESHRWREFDRVVALAPLLVLGRAGYDAASARPVTLPEVSSTDIRARLSAGNSVAGVVPANVINYIRANHLYATDGAVA